MVSSHGAPNLYLNKSMLSDCRATWLLSGIHEHLCKIWQWFAVTWRWQLRAPGFLVRMFCTPETGKVCWKEVASNWYPKSTKEKDDPRPPQYSSVLLGLFTDSLEKSLLKISQVPGILQGPRQSKPKTPLPKLLQDHSDVDKEIRVVY